MKNIKRWFENNCENYDFVEYDGHLEARTKTVLYLIVAPHSGTHNRWMLRVTTMTAFDRWANSTVIEAFFDNEIELCNYLYEHQLDIYKNLLEYLSEEYDEVVEMENKAITKEQEQLKKSWLQIMAILKETGYDYLYMEDISRVASVIRKEIGLDK